MKLLKVPAETGSLDRVNAFTEEALERCGCPMKSQMQVALAAEERGIGGLGILLVKKSMDHVTYSYEGGKNILTIKKTL